eukprot:TRINITY_DN6865_c0_g1_i4.p2 TRINITY_DN6865_c0_g1~~TRINITY_DN6865_c0_g1_i4.p2  ORF type:complete len:212 (+),score=46.83 TRINITY_DN6865_c0_g1_i4:73-708(+)
MCIRDSINAEYMGVSTQSTWPQIPKTPKPQNPLVKWNDILCNARESVLAMSFQCNNFKCRKRVEGSCLLTSCFHVFCQACVHPSLAACPVCAAPSPRMRSFVLPVKKQGAGMKLVGMDLEDIATAVHTALGFLKSQKDFEQKYQLARLAGYKRSLDELKAKKEIERQKQKEIKLNCQKLVQDRDLLSSINQSPGGSSLTQELLDNDIFDLP